jgi:hypothetical protein
VYDTINHRIILLGGESRTVGENPHWTTTEDVWAYDLQTNLWIRLLAPR